MDNITRRNALKVSGISLAALSLSSKQAFASDLKDKKKKIVVFGAHPDDPETGCGGTMALLSAMGHEVISAYLTKGQAGIPGIKHSEAAEIRAKEALKACDILRVKAKFFEQIDGDCKIDKMYYSEIIKYLKNENPDIVFTHWPIDTHRDHRICSILVYDAFLALGKSFELYYYEVMSGMQSQNFNPTDYVDISKVLQQKHKACYSHESQQINDDFFNMSHGPMEKFRGMEFGCEYAEAFIKHNLNKTVSIV